jgi:hypothetical protein
MRRARVVVSLDFLRLVFDLPRHLTITGVTEDECDRVNGTCSVLVAGPYCPEAPEGAPAPELALIFRHVAPGRAYLETIHGLDT